MRNRRYRAIALLMGMLVLGCNDPTETPEKGSAATPPTLATGQNAPKSKVAARGPAKPASKLVAPKKPAPKLVAPKANQGFVD